MKKNKSKLKITLTLQKDGKKVFIYPSLKKMQFFLRNKANRYFKNGYSITIRVIYGKIIDAFGKNVVSQNSGTYEKVEDLRWAYQAFVKEYLSES